MKTYGYLFISGIGLAMGQAYAMGVENVSAEAIGSSGVRVSWDASEGAAYYELYQDSLLLRSGISETEAEVSGLSAGSAYQFFVTACDASGMCSEASMQADVMTTAAVNAGLGACDAGAIAPDVALLGGDDGLAVLSWCSVAEAQGYNLFLNGDYLTTVGSSTYSTVVDYSGAEEYQVAWYADGFYPPKSAVAAESDTPVEPPADSDEDMLAALDAASSDNPDDVEIYFTRHAEKMTQLAEQEDGSFIEVCGESKCAEVLNAKGELRAELLAGLFSDAGITQRLTNAFSSHKIRTRQTIELITAEAGLTGDIDKFPNDGIQEYPVSNDDGTADATELDPESTSPSEAPVIEALLSLPAGSVALVAGHSGTLYDIMAGIGLGDVCLKDTVDSCDTNRYPIDEDVKVKNFGDIWKVTLQDGEANFVYRVNLQPAQLHVQELAQ